VLNVQANFPSLQPMNIRNHTPIIIKHQTGSHHRAMCAKLKTSTHSSRQATQLRAPAACRHCTTPWVIIHHHMGRGFPSLSKSRTTRNANWPCLATYQSLRSANLSSLTMRNVELECESASHSTLSRWKRCPTLIASRTRCFPVVTSRCR
jgi:hypothetical protein